MNSNKYSKVIKRKIATSFNMGQKNAAPTKSQSCSIFSLDEDVKFVVDNNDDSFSAVVPIDSECELSTETYSEEQIITYSTIPQRAQPFEFPLLSDLQPLPGKSCAPKSKIRYPLKRKLDDKFTNHVSKKVSKTEIASKSQPATSKSLSRNSVSRNKTKTVFVESEISSDSDVEVVEVKVVNPKSMSSFMRKPLMSHIDSNNKRKFAHLLKRKNDAHLSAEQVTKPCFMAGNELFVNEADTAPFMPNNPLFHEIHSVPNTIEWRNTSSSMEILHYKEQSIVKKPETSPFATSKTPVLKTSLIDQKKVISNKRELKSLYENLNEISWTQESSFKNLLRNPDYIRHSERSTGRIAGTGKTLRKVKSNVDNKPAFKSKIIKKPQVARNSPTKINLAQSNSSKKLLAIKAPTSNKVNKVTKPRTRTPAVICDSKLPDDKRSKISLKNKKDKNLKPNKKIKLMAPPKLKSSPKCIKTENPENVTDSKSEKKPTSPTNEKMRVQVKKESVKLKNENKAKPSVPSKEKNKAVPLPKVEISEASSSGLQNSLCKNSSLNAGKGNHKMGNSKKYLSKEDLQAKKFEIFKDYMKDYYNFQRELRVEVQPLEFTQHWKSLYFEDLRKAFMHQALCQANVERREPNGVATMLQELCDSYLMSNSVDDKFSKKKKPEEETLRSSARQINGAFRYKDIAVKKCPDYIHIILVSNLAKKNILTIDAIKELKEVFLIAKKDPKCKAVLLSSGGSYFCRGIDLSVLIGPNKKQACEEMATVIKDLILTLGAFTKPVVAAVNGAAVGFGVSLLTHCDVVFASDKAFFSIPSTSIGYMPEGGLTLTLPQIVGNIRCSEMLLQGKKITAQEAHAKGLVNEVLWPSHFMNEVMPRFEAILTQTLPVMEATKLLVRANVWDKLKSQMDFERKLLVGQWLSAPCQEGIKKYLRHNAYNDD